jgi:acyl-coenzyme A synthetase/AMP-(fatty) acid ligase
VLDLPALRTLQDHASCAWDRGDPDPAAYIVFTSGSSGCQRAVLHAHRAIRARRMMWAGWYGLTATGRILHTGAFNRTYTLGTGLPDPWAAGATALIPGSGVDAAQIPLLLRRYDATLFTAAPGIYRQMLRDHAKFDLPRLRHGLSVGETLPETTRAAWTAATGAEVHEALGMSECSTFVSGSPARPAPPGTTGYPQPGRRLAVLGADGRRCRAARRERCRCRAAIRGCFSATLMPRRKHCRAFAANGS